MRSMSAEQIVLLFVLVGIPLLRALARWLRSLRSSAEVPAYTPPTPTALDDEEEPPTFWSPSPPVVAPEPPAPPPVPARTRSEPPPGFPVRKTPDRAADSSWAIGNPRSRAARAGRELVRGGSLAVHQAFVWRTVLGPPKSLEGDEDER